jgi:hypothetical protein
MKSLQEELQWVANAVAVGRVSVRHQYMTLEDCERQVPRLMRIQPISRTHMPLRGEQLRDLRHFLWVMRQLPVVIPKDLQLYMYNFMRDGRVRDAMRALTNSEYIQPCSGEPLLTITSSRNGKVWACPKDMVRDSPLLSGIDAYCEPRTAFADEPDYIIEWVVDAYTADSMCDMVYYQTVSGSKHRIVSQLELQTLAMFIID